MQTPLPRTGRGGLVTISCYFVTQLKSQWVFNMVATNHRSTRFCVDVWAVNGFACFGGVVELTARRVVGCVVGWVVGVVLLVCVVVGVGCVVFTVIGIAWRDSHEVVVVVGM